MWIYCTQCILQNYYANLSNFILISFFVVCGEHVGSVQENKSPFLVSPIKSFGHLWNLVKIWIMIKFISLNNFIAGTHYILLSISFWSERHTCTCTFMLLVVVNIFCVFLSMCTPAKLCIQNKRLSWSPPAIFCLWVWSPPNLRNCL